MKKITIILLFIICLAKKPIYGDELSDLKKEKEKLEANLSPENSVLLNKTINNLTEKDKDDFLRTMTKITEFVERTKSGDFTKLFEKDISPISNNIFELAKELKELVQEIDSSSYSSHSEELEKFEKKLLIFETLLNTIKKNGNIIVIDNKKKLAKEIFYSVIQFFNEFIARAKEFPQGLHKTFYVFGKEKNRLTDSIIGRMTDIPILEIVKTYKILLELSKEKNYQQEISKVFDQNALDDKKTRPFRILHYIVNYKKQGGIILKDEDSIKMYYENISPVINKVLMQQGYISIPLNK